MSLFDKVARGIDVFAFYLFLHLRNIYRRQYNVEYADLLAVAVSNELLSRKPGNEKGQTFLKENLSVIKEKASEIKIFHELCIDISETVNMQTLIDTKTIETNDLEIIHNHYEQISKPIEKLKEYNIYTGNDIPSSFFSLRKRMKSFVEMVSRFQKEVGSN